VFRKQILAAIAVMAPILAVIVIMAPPPSSAQDVRGSSDHPLFPTRMPGYSIAAFQTREFSVHRFVGDPPKEVEGKYTAISYYRGGATPHPGGLATRRNYETAIKAVGGEVIFTRGYYSVMRGTWRGREVWAEIRASDTGRYYFLTIIEKEPMVQVITASQMGTALDRDGFIALDIQFDFAKSSIKPESRPAIAEMASLMKARPGMRIGIEGHTDDVGDPQSNKALSLKRARAVVVALVAAGVPETRLVAAGFGEERPVADNRTEEGRARNRRVEMVKK
jgi:outer membrane protein OmpA-like peptidoglycan-associated protein